MSRFSASIIRTLLVVFFATLIAQPALAEKRKKDPKTVQSITRALDYLAREQRRLGYWEASQQQYRVAMTALAANALICEGSTTTRGKYAKNIQSAVEYLISLADKKTGLIGFHQDYHYTYGHGFSMLFLSQVYGEEEDSNRRKDLKRVLTKAVEFSIKAQTARGGWGYVSAKDGNGFDEGSTCITQVQGLRACRNAGISVPKEVIDKAKKYIHDCMTPEGGVQYSIRGGGPRPPITAAAAAAMFNAGDTESDDVKRLLKFCERNISPKGGSSRSFGHWHYTHYYYAQVKYRGPVKEWNKYIDVIGPQIMQKQSANGSWKEGHVGPVYTTAMNATILQLDNGFLPIYQK